MQHLILFGHQGQQKQELAQHFHPQVGPWRPREAVYSGSMNTEADTSIPTLTMPFIKSHPLYGFLSVHGRSFPYLLCKDSMRGSDLASQVSTWKQSWQIGASAPKRGRKSTVLYGSHSSTRVTIGSWGIRGTGGRGQITKDQDPDLQESVSLLLSASSILQYPTHSKCSANIH